jgi:hypothetical protein
MTRRYRSLLPWNWGEREESTSRSLPVSRFSSFPSFFGSLENHLQELSRFLTKEARGSLTGGPIVRFKKIQIATLSALTCRELTKTTSGLKQLKIRFI